MEIVSKEKLPRYSWPKANTNKLRSVREKSKDMHDSIPCQ